MDIQHSAGDVVQIVAPAPLTGGTPYRVSPKLFGVPVADAASGANAALAVTGEFRLPKQGGAGVTFALGAKVYWSQSTGYCTATATDDLIGVCTGAAANADTTVRTLINGQVQDAVDADGIAGALGSLNGHVVKTSSTAVAAVKDNLAGTAAPGASDDTTAGYAVGSEWIDTTNKRVYRCADATAAAAVWLVSGVPVKAGTLTIASGGSTGTASVGAAYNGFPVLLTFGAATNIAVSPAVLKGAVAGGTLTATLIKADDATAINAAANIPVWYAVIGNV